MACNRTGEDERRGRIRALAAFIGVLVAATTIWSIAPAKTAAGELAQAALLALASIIGVAWAQREALRIRRRPRKNAAAGPAANANAAAGPATPAGALAAAAICIGLAGGALATACAAFARIPSPACAPEAGTVLVFALSCLLTGIFEEGAFRVLALDALRLPRANESRSLLFAAAASSALFGIAHIGVADFALANDAVTWLQLVLKPVQAALFGLVLAALFVESGSLWTVAAVHGAFNVFYLSPAILGIGGPAATHATGSPADAIALAATTALLVPPAVASWRAIARRRQNP